MIRRAIMAAKLRRAPKYPPSGFSRNKSSTSSVAWCNSKLLSRSEGNREHRLSWEHETASEATVEPHELIIPGPLLWVEQRVLRELDRFERVLRALEGALKARLAAVGQWRDLIWVEASGELPVLLFDFLRCDF